MEIPLKMEAVITALTEQRNAALDEVARLRAAVVTLSERLQEAAAKDGDAE